MNMNNPDIYNPQAPHASVHPSVHPSIHMNVNPAYPSQVLPTDPSTNSSSILPRKIQDQDEIHTQLTNPKGYPLQPNLARFHAPNHYKHHAFKKPSIHGIHIVHFKYRKKNANTLIMTGPSQIKSDLAIHDIGPFKKSLKNAINAFPFRIFIFLPFKSPNNYFPSILFLIRCIISMIPGLLFDMITL